MNDGGEEFDKSNASRASTDQFNSRRSSTGSSKGGLRVVIDSSPVASAPRSHRIASSVGLSVNDGLVLLAEFRPDTEWAGPLSSPSRSKAGEISRRIVGQARRITEKLDTGRGKDQSDESWQPHLLEV